MLLSKIGPVAALGFFIITSITSLVFVVPGSVHSFATFNNNNENMSSASSLTTPDGKEHRKTRDVADTNQSSSSFSSQSPLPSSFVQQSNGDSNSTSQPGALLVTKQVANDGGGEAEPSDFTITVDGNNPTPSSFDGSSSGTSVQLFEGRYKVSESGPDSNSNSNYTSKLSKECSGMI